MKLIYCGVGIGVLNQLENNQFEYKLFRFVLQTNSISSVFLKDVENHYDIIVWKINPKLPSADPVNYSYSFH